jgi:hypothetical protein
MCFFCGLLGCLGVWNGAESISIGVWLYLPSSIAGINNSRSKVNRGLVLLNTTCYDDLLLFLGYSSTSRRESSSAPNLLELFFLSWEHE